MSLDPPTFPRALRPAALSLFLAAFACEGPSAPGRDIPEPPVVAVNMPLSDFARRLGEGLVEVENPTPIGEDPQDWMPDEAAVARVQQATLILLQGDGAGPWGDVVALPASRIVDTTAEARERFPATTSSARHRHGGGEHDHAATAAQAWLDLEIARLQARSVRDALVRLRPQSEAQIDARWRTLDQDLAALDEQFREALRGAPPLLASHPVYGFLANAHGLSIESVHWEPEDEPDDDAFAELAALRDAHGASLMLWEAEPRPAMRRRLEEMGLRVVVFEPLAASDGERGFIESMQGNLARIREALAAPSSSETEHPDE